MGQREKTSYSEGAYCDRENAYRYRGDEEQ
jgi:hypothetical protein